MKGDLRRLGATALGLFMALVGADLVAAHLFREAPAWLAAQDPRQLTLWQRPDPTSPVVLIGDSVLYSYFIDSPEQAISRRLEERLGVRVFLAAMTGARPGDLLAMARRVASLWPPGTTAIVGIHPAHLFGPGGGGSVAGGGAARVWRLGGDGTNTDGTGALGALEQKLAAQLAARSFLVRNRDAILWYLDTQLKRGRRQVVGDNRNSRWDADEGGALVRFRGLEAALAGGGASRKVRYSWVEEIDAALRASGIRAVFALTPLNVDLVRRYSGQDIPVESILGSSHEYLVERLAASRIEFIDMFSALDSPSFADAIHTNARGNDELAAAIAAWLRARPATGR